jgi:diadenosine tetraphosphate (Ap4A) HIT family hydrolase
VPSVILAVVDTCPYCSVPADRIWIENEVAIAFSDAVPVTAGHILVVPRKHVGIIYELTAAEQKAVWALVANVRGRLLTDMTPDSFDIGFDDREPGSAVAHTAIHLVPRRKGDELGTAEGYWVKDDLAL